MVSFPGVMEEACTAAAECCGRGLQQGSCPPGGVSPTQLLGILLLVSCKALAVGDVLAF